MQREFPGCTAFPKAIRPWRPAPPFENGDPPELSGRASSAKATIAPELRIPFSLRPIAANPSRRRRSLKRLRVFDVQSMGNPGACFRKMGKIPFPRWKAGFRNPINCDRSVCHKASPEGGAIVASFAQFLVSC